MEGLFASQKHAETLEERAKLKVIPGCGEVCTVKPPSAKTRSAQTHALLLAAMHQEGFSRTGVINNKRNRHAHISYTHMDMHTHTHTPTL